MPYKRRYTTPDPDEFLKRKRHLEGEPFPLLDRERHFRESIRRPWWGLTNYQDQATDQTDDTTTSSWLPKKTQPPTELLDEPSLYITDEDGNRVLNPDYDTSIGQDILAGAGIALQQKTGNPFHDIGLALGGLAGGVFAKNIAGKKRHAQDVEDIRQHNRSVISKTEAQVRLEQIAANKKITANREKATEIRASIAAETDRAKRIATRGKYIPTLPDGEELIRVQTEQLLDQGMPQDNISDFLEDNPDWGRFPGKAVRSGDKWMRTNESGEVRYLMNDDGTPATNVKLSELKRIAALEAKLDIEKPVDREAIDWAFTEADLIIDKQIKEKKLKSFKYRNGRTNAMAENAYRLKIATLLLKGRDKEGKPPSKIQMWIEDVEKELFVGQPSTATTTPTTEAQSQFMPEIKDENTMPPSDVLQAVDINTIQANEVRNVTTASGSYTVGRDERGKLTWSKDVSHPEKKPEQKETPLTRENLMERIDGIDNPVDMLNMISILREQANKDGEDQLIMQARQKADILLQNKWKKKLPTETPEGFNAARIMVKDKVDTYWIRPVVLTGIKGKKGDVRLLNDKNYWFDGMYWYEFRPVW